MGGEARGKVVGFVRTCHDEEFASLRKSSARILAIRMQLKYSQYKHRNKKILNLTLVLKTVIHLFILFFQLFILNILIFLRVTECTTTGLWISGNSACNTNLLANGPLN